MITRIWPPELEPYLDDPRAILGPAGETFVTRKDGSQLSLNVCPNCGGHENMRVYIPTAGPFRSPNGAKVTWLEFPDDKSKNGWCTYDLHISHCPVCRLNGMAEYLQRNSGLSGTNLEVTLNGFSTAGPLTGKQSAKDQAATLLAMNRKPLDLPGEFGYIASRMKAGLILDIPGPDVCEALGLRAQQVHGVNS